MKPRTIREAAVSGSFYPDDPLRLRNSIEQFLASASPQTATPKAIIAPHAGYVYSGSVAASAYAALQDRQHPIQRVVLLGPSHRVALEGLALSSAVVYSTPLGEIPIDQSAQESLLDLPFVQFNDQAHAQEHSLEVHLPFLQEVLGDFRIVPVVAGAAPAQQVAELLDRLWGGPETLIVVSSDLSHYHDYETAKTLDSATSRAIENLHWQELDFESACGSVPVSGLLYTAKKRGMRAVTADLRNSGDTAGPRDRVVGYGAYLFS